LPNAAQPARCVTTSNCLFSTCSSQRQPPSRCWRSSRCAGALAAVAAGHPVGALLQ
jgi:hypothetical protein